MNNINLPDIHALWIGENLGPLARCCLKSFTQQGHKVILHTYSKINDLPGGIELADANKIVSNNKIIKGGFKRQVQQYKNQP